ncbi:MAG: sigma-70 factor domain-containing protein, partial [Planctomycetota bacterium]
MTVAIAGGDLVVPRTPRGSGLNQIPTVSTNVLARVVEHAVSEGRLTLGAFIDGLPDECVNAESIAMLLQRLRELQIELVPGGGPKNLADELAEDDPADGVGDEHGCHTHHDSTEANLAADRASRQSDDRGDVHHRVVAISDSSAESTPRSDADSDLQPQIARDPGAATRRQKKADRLADPATAAFLVNGDRELRADDTDGENSTDGDERSAEAAYAESDTDSDADGDADGDGETDALDEIDLGTDTAVHDDPVQTYLVQMGSIELLSRTKEIRLAKAIEVTRFIFRHLILENGDCARRALAIVREVERGDVPFDRVMRISTLR